MRMNDKPATAGTQTFEPRDLDLRKVPGQSELFLDFLYHPEKAARFYPNISCDQDRFAETVLDAYKPDRKALCEALSDQNREYGGGETVSKNISRLASTDCVAVMTGQQAGLFTGPLYTIYKAVSAILRAEELTRSGIEAVPVFWIASEDHDIDEVRRIAAIDGEGGIREFEYVASDTDSKPVGFVKFDGSVAGLAERFSDSLPETRFTDGVRDLLAETYKEGDTFSSSFGKAIADLFREWGLILVSPLDPAIRRLAVPFVREAVENAVLVRSALIERNKDLEAAGYHSQVLVGPDFFPFFLIDENASRVALRLDETGTKLIPQDGSPEFLIEELLARFDRNPGCLSPNALMRPAVQDYLFPNVCYYGGGAEVAYFAQNAALYGALKRPVTPIRHRSSFTVIEPRDRRTLEKYGLEFEDVFRGREEIYAEVIEGYLDPETAGAFEEAEGAIGSILDSLQERLERSEPTLAESLSKRREKMLWHISALRGKFSNAESIKDETAARRLRYLFNTLFPNDGLQERTLGAFHFIDLYGDRFIEWVVESADADQKDHRLLFL
jgi:bacillithiol biosynthesis cysteine-adding enzyme BshC